MSKSDQKVHARGKEEQEWCFTVPDMTIRHSKLQLLTIGGVSVTGKWMGHLGQYFVAWAPLLDVNREPVQVANGPRR